MLGIDWGIVSISQLQRSGRNARDSLDPARSRKKPRRTRLSLTRRKAPAHLGQTAETDPIDAQNTYPLRKGFRGVKASCISSPYLIPTNLYLSLSIAVTSHQRRQQCQDDILMEGRFHFHYQHVSQSLPQQFGSLNTLGQHHVDNIISAFINIDQQASFDSPGIHNVRHLMPKTCLTTTITTCAGYLEGCSGYTRLVETITMDEPSITSQGVVHSGEGYFRSYVDDTQQSDSEQVAHLRQKQGTSPKE